MRACQGMADGQRIDRGRDPECPLWVILIPGGNCKRVITPRADVPIILYTGYVKESCAAATARIGVKAILNKPFTAADLVRTFRGVLKAK